MKPNKSEAIVGLDLGSYSVKCVELARDGDAIRILRAELLPVTPEADVRSHLQKLGLAGGSPVCVALSGPSVVIRRISMPLLTARELQGAIRFEAESHIPFSIDDCVLDYQVLSQDASKKEMNILLAAAKRDLVDSRYKLLTEAGIFPERMDLDIFCLANAFEVLNPAPPEKQYGLLNIGHRASSFVIIRDGLPVFVREIAFGGAGVTKALAELKGLSERDADALKIKKTAGEEGALGSATQKGFEPLSEEIRQSIDYVENEIKEELKKIYLGGGGAMAAGAPEILAQEIGRPVQFWDSLKKIQPAGKTDPGFLKEHSAEWAVALGMALRGRGVA